MLTKLAIIGLAGSVLAGNAPLTPVEVKFERFSKPGCHHADIIGHVHHIKPEEGCRNMAGSGPFESYLIGPHEHYTGKEPWICHATVYEDKECTGKGIDMGPFDTSMGHCADTPSHWKHGGKSMRVHCDWPSTGPVETALPMASEPINMLFGTLPSEPTDYDTMEMTVTHDGVHTGLHTETSTFTHNGVHTGIHTETATYLVPKPTTEETTVTLHHTTPTTTITLVPQSTRCSMRCD